MAGCDTILGSSFSVIRIERGIYFGARVVTHHRFSRLKSCREQYQLVDARKGYECGCLADFTSLFSYDITPTPHPPCLLTITSKLAIGQENSMATETR